MRQKSLIIIPVLTLSFLISCNSKLTQLTRSSYTVTFDSKGGSYTPDPQRVVSGKQASEPEEAPTKDDFTFGGWYTDEEAKEYKYDFARPVVTDLTLYAKWEDAHKLVSVTFDAKEGLYSDTSSHVSFLVPSGSQLYPYINIMKEFEPTATDKVFACYSYQDDIDAAIDYKDVINSDITLEANYLPKNKSPYSNLNSFSWNYIKKVAVTKNDDTIDDVFALGATKTVELYGENHQVRIIGYSHDKLASTTNEDIKAGLTFEFVNLITKDGSSCKTYWDTDETNVFLNSDLYTLVDDVYDDLPDDLQEVTQLAEKNVGVGFEKDVTPVLDSTPYNTRLFPLAHDEISEPCADDQPIGEGTLYEYYETHTEAEYRMKAPAGKKAEDASETYWLRSPYCTWYLYYPNAWIVFDGTGLLAGKTVCETDQEHEEFGFAPAFCI